jgi:hypothetical protein
MHFVWSDSRESAVTRDDLRAAYRRVGEVDIVQAAGALVRWWRRSSGPELEELEELEDAGTPAPSVSRREGAGVARDVDSKPGFLSGRATDKRAQP